MRHLDDAPSENRARAPAGKRLTSKADRARARSEQAAYDAQHRGLAGAVGADDAREASLLDGEVDPLKDIAATVAEDLRRQLQDFFEAKNTSPRKDVTTIPATFLRVTVRA